MFINQGKSAWDMNLVARNKGRLRQIFVQAAEIYNQNLGSGEEQTVLDENGQPVVIAQPTIVPENYKVVWGYNLLSETSEQDVPDGYGNITTVRSTNSNYTNLLIAYSERDQSIFFVHISREADSFGEMLAYFPGDYSKLSFNWFTNTYTIFDQTKNALDKLVVALSPNRKFTFVVPEQTDLNILASDGEPILTYIKQNDEAQQFKAWFDLVKGRIKA